MAIDFRKNKDSLEKAFRQITDDNDSTNWVIYGYEGQTCCLKIVETGDGGVDEMVEELSAGRMQYAYCRVKDPNTALDKYVLIQWTGESVPENIKLKYTTHLKDVQAYVKTVHVTVAARTEMDIDESDIVKKVSKASGANYSFHKEKAKAEESPAPVGTDYRRVRPDREINLKERDKFWSQTEKDEISRRNENKTKMDDERKHMEEQRKEREHREAEERDKRVAERMKEIGVQKAVERKSDRRLDEDVNEEKKKWVQVQKESSIDEEERGHRSDQLRRERVAEAAHLVSQSAAKSRDFFKQKSTERPDIVNRDPPPPRKLVRELGQQEKLEPVKKEPIQLPKEEIPARSLQPTAAHEAELVPTPVHEPELEPTPVHEPEPQVSEPEGMNLPESTPISRNMLMESLPPRQHYDSEEEQAQDWDEPSGEPRVPSAGDGSLVEPGQGPGSHQSGPSTTEESGHPGLCARALYDYQAADDTEISFDPNDIITNIEQIDEGWWQGFGPDGSYGMFPANYVELEG